MNHSIHILVVEDDPDINGLLHKMLQGRGYHVHSAFSGSEASMCLDQYDFHLVLLDLMLPGFTGEELITKIRAAKTMPIIVISAKGEQDTKIDVLQLGADDFITKPFDISEVIARVEAQLRRYLLFSQPSDQNPIWRYKELTLDPETYQVFLKDQEVLLTGKEFSILALLMAYPKKVFTKSNLFEHIWNDTFLGDDNTVNVHISNLRSKLAKVDPDTEYIRTVWGIGFKMQDL